MIRDERDLQAWFRGLVAEGHVLDAIDGADRLLALNEMLGQQELIPAFPVDYLLRKRAIQAGAFVIDVLREVDIVSEMKNVSLRRQERLFPDLTLVNSERACFVAVELKFGRAVEREVASELAGYGQEIRNHLPFLSANDLCFVVVASEFSALTDHALASLIGWDRKKVLCLEVVSANSDHPRLVVHLPAAWSPLGQSGLPGSGFETVDLALYDASLSEADLWVVVSTAARLTAARGGREGYHGFVLGWRHALHPKLSSAAAVLTIGTIDPFSFLKAADTQNFIRAQGSALGRFLTDGGGGLELSASRDWLMHVGAPAVKYLSDYGRPTWEGFAGWNELRADNRHEADWPVDRLALPLGGELFGAVAEYAEELFSSPAYRRFMPELFPSAEDLSNPRIAVHIADGVSLPQQSQEFTCSRMLNLGVRLGRFQSLTKNALAQPENVPLAAMTWWAEADLLGPLSEVRTRFLAAENLDEPPPALRFGDRTSAPEEWPGIQSFVDWMEQEFLGSDLSSPHAIFFALGLKLHFLFDAFMRTGLSDDALSEAQQLAIRHSRSWLIASCEVCSSDYIRPYQKEQIGRCLEEYYGIALGLHHEEWKVAVESLTDGDLLESFLVGLPAVVDAWWPVLGHAISMPNLDEVDWEWFQDQARLRRETNSDPVVITIDSGGGVSLAVRADLEQASAQLSPADDEILVALHNSVAEVLVKARWRDLITGRVPGLWPAV